MIRRMLFMIALLAATTAQADTASDAAAHATAGKKAFAEARYTDAISEFRAANALQADPKLLYAIAQAQRMAGDCAGAIVSYEEFIKTKSDAKLTEYSQANITRCKEQLAKEPVKEPIKEPIEEPVKEPVQTPPPTVASPEVPPPQPPQPHDTSGPRWTSDWIGHGLVGGGVAIGVIGAVLWTGGRADARKPDDATDYDSFIAKRDAADGAVTKQRLGIGLGVLGIAAIAVGVYHYRSATHKEVRIGAAPSAGGGTVAARFTF